MSVPGVAVDEVHLPQGPGHGQVALQGVQQLLMAVVLGRQLHGRRDALHRLVVTRFLLVSEAQDFYGEVIVPLLENPTQVTTGKWYTCAIHDSGIKCWGECWDGPCGVVK